MNTIPVGVLGASGYAGRELCEIIVRHPFFSLAFATANEQRGQTVRAGRREITFIASDDAPLGAAEIVFCALPHGASLTWVERARAQGARVIDLSSDFRPGHGDAAARAVYGMPELGSETRSAIASADIIANPGCYPTSILLALAPLASAGLIAPDALIIANSASGVTGAGNSPKRELLFAEMREDYRAYGVGNTHRHVREMVATMATFGAADADLVFTPHLLPVARGILSSITVPLVRVLDDATEPFRLAYQDELFVEVVREQPRLRDVVHRNVVRMTATMITGTRAPALLVTSAIDNLLKGAAGQAVQNANIMCALAECAGLPT